MDAITLLTEQHRQVERLADEFLALGPDDLERKRDIAREVIAALSIHATIEEMAFYPLIAEAVPPLADRVDQNRHEHLHVKHLLQDLHGMAPDEARFATTMVQLVGAVKAHVDEEERELFPEVRAELTEAELGELGDRLAELAAVAPTHPHPWAPDTPPLNTTLDPIVGRLDRVRDAIRDRLKSKSV